MNTCSGDRSAHTLQWYWLLYSPTNNFFVSINQFVLFFVFNPDFKYLELISGCDQILLYIDHQPLHVYPFEIVFRTSTSSTFITFIVLILNFISSVISMTIPGQLEGLLELVPELWAGGAVDDKVDGGVQHRCVPRNPVRAPLNTKNIARCLR